MLWGAFYWHGLGPLVPLEQGSVIYGAHANTGGMIAATQAKCNKVFYSLLKSKN